jgi:hypothetical protein
MSSTHSSSRRARVWQPGCRAPWHQPQQRLRLRHDVHVCVFDKLRGMLGQQQQSKQQQQQQQSSEEEGDDDQDAEMARIDPDSDGGLGGTTEDVFGPLVRAGVLCRFPAAQTGRVCVPMPSVSARRQQLSGSACHRPPPPPPRHLTPEAQHTRAHARTRPTAGAAARARACAGGAAGGLHAAGGGLVPGADERHGGRHRQGVRAWGGGGGVGGGGRAAWVRSWLRQQARACAGECVCVGAAPRRRQGCVGGQGAGGQQFDSGSGSCSCAWLLRAAGCGCAGVAAGRAAALSGTRAAATPAACTDRWACCCRCRHGVRRPRPAPLQIVPCTRAMLEGSLLQALETEGPAYEQVGWAARAPAVRWCASRVAAAALWAPAQQLAWRPSVHGLLWHGRACPRRRCMSHRQHVPRHKHDTSKPAHACTHTAAAGPAACAVPQRHVWQRGDRGYRRI